MKKIIAVLLAVLLVLPFFSLVLSAESSSESEANTPSYPTLKENSVSYVCQYRAESRAIAINGSVNYDILITHQDYQLEVYALMPGETIDTVLKGENVSSVASTAISVKFEFLISAEKVLERFSRYAIVLLSPEGERILAAEPQYVEVVSSDALENSDGRAYKGVVSSSASLVGSLGAGTTILTVDLNRIWSETTNGYMIPVEDSYRYFDQNYVDDLDASVRTCSATGTKVYFQFVLPSVGSALAIADGAASGAAYDMPDVYNPDVLASITAVFEFLAARYDSYQSGLIGGVIVGRSIDLFQMNWNGGLSLEQYAEQYAYYLTVVAGSMRALHPTLDIILPFSHADSYAEEYATSEEGYVSSALLERILFYLDRGCAYRFFCGTLIESDLLPKLPLEAEGAESSLEQAESGENCLTVDTLTKYSEYITDLSLRYHSAPTHYMYQWTVPEQVTGNALACAYAYAYYRLHGEANILSFVIALGENGIADIEKIIRYMDTKESFAVTEFLLPYFGAESWQDLVGELSLDSLTERSVYRAQTETPTTAWKGAFSYFDFSSGNIPDWSRGIGCTRVSSDYDAEGVRVLRTTMKQEESRYAEVLCLYEYPENTVYTPFMELELLISEGAKETRSLYEIVISFGNEDSVVTAEYMIQAGEKATLLLDMTAYASEHLITFCKVSTRVLDGDTKSYTVNLYGITGYSMIHSSEELDALIQAERLKIRNQSGEDEETDSKNSLTWIIFCVLFAVTAVGVGVYMLIKKDETETPNEPAKASEDIGRKK